jgi:hypothetical protein
LRQLLAFYNIKVSDLGQHNVQQVSLFVALCECYLGCPPYFPLFVALCESIFRGRAAQMSKSNQMLVSVSGITFQVKPGEAFIDMARSRLPLAPSTPPGSSRGSHPHRCRGLGPPWSPWTASTPSPPSGSSELEEMEDWKLAGEKDEEAGSGAK